MLAVRGGSEADASKRLSGAVMADVAGCIDKLVGGGQITRKVADKALEFFNRSKAEYSTQLHSAGES